MQRTLAGEFEAAIEAFSAALAVTKDALNREASLSMLPAFEHEGRVQARCMQSPNFREAYEAFVAKREPRFR